MGLVISFPDVWRNTRTMLQPGEEASVIILPVVRIEREVEKVSEQRTRSAPRRRRRPASRS